MHDCHDCNFERKMLEINTPDMEEVSRTLGKRLSNGIHQSIIQWTPGVRATDDWLKKGLTK